MHSSESSNPMSPSPLPPFARAVLELYAQSLQDVRFPGLDLAALQNAARELEEARGDAEACLAAVRAAEAEVMAREASLTALADRALAYARIYAAGNAQLTAQVGAIGQQPAAEAGEGAVARKRGRPRKASGAPELFGAIASSAEGPAVSGEDPAAESHHANAAE